MARLRIKESTLKKLFALSRNQCAFPKCGQPLVNEHGDLIADICHIEAAELNGERYNATQTDEARRSFDNLILLCPTHHRTTDNVTEYTVEKLQRMKRQHEAGVVADQFSFTADQWKRLRTGAIRELMENPRWTAFLDEIFANNQDLSVTKELKQFLYRLPLDQTLSFTSPDSTFTNGRLNLVNKLFLEYRAFSAEAILDENGTNVRENVFTTAMFLSNWVANCIAEDQATEGIIESELIMIFNEVLWERQLRWTPTSSAKLLALKRAIRKIDDDHAFPMLLWDFTSAVE